MNGGALASYRADSTPVALLLWPLPILLPPLPPLHHGRDERSVGVGPVVLRGRVTCRLEHLDDRQAERMGNAQALFTS